MKSKLAIVILVGCSIVLSWACWFSIRFFGEVLSDVAGDRPTGSFSLLAYRSTSLIYGFPVPLAVWAAFLIRRKEVSSGDFNLFLSVTILVFVVFLAVFLLAVLIPFTQTDPIILQPIEYTP